MSARPSRWDTERRKKRGIHDDRIGVLPRCVRCRQISVLSPCRGCATSEELKNYPPAPAGRHNPERE